MGQDTVGRRTRDISTQPGRRGADARRCRIQTLGRLRIDHDERIELTRTSHRRLLSILLLDPGQRITVDRLIDRFWGASPPRTARAAIHTHISALRSIVPPELITTDGSGYLVDTGDHWHDAIDFDLAARSAVRSVRRGQWAVSLRAADAALALWNGEPFTELADDPFAQAEISRLRELRLAAIEARAESLLALGRPREAVPDLEWAVRRFPLREHVSALLARARQQTGSHAEALRSLRAVERALAELGLEPSPALRSLESQILNHESGVPTLEYVGPERRRTA